MGDLLNCLLIYVRIKSNIVYTTTTTTAAAAAAAATTTIYNAATVPIPLLLILTYLFTYLLTYLLTCSNICCYYYYHHHYYSATSAVLLLLHTSYRLKFTALSRGFPATARFTCLL